ncbi:MAG: hypothetical protein AAGB24_03995 [Bacteroidota bacterium]
MKERQPLSKLEKQVKSFAYLKQYDSAIVYAKKMLLLSSMKGDSISMGKAHFRLGFYHKKLDSNVTAFRHYNLSYQIHRFLGDSISAASRLNSMANIQKKLGDFSGCRVTALDALALYKEVSNFERLSSIYHIISVSLKEEKGYKESLKWNDRLINLLNAHKSKINPGSSLVYKNSRANILAELKDYETSIQILQDLLEDTMLDENRNEYARVLANLGRIKWMQNAKNHESEALMLKALDMRKSINSISGLIASNVHLTKYYQENNPKKALVFGMNALENAKKLNNPISILEALDLIIPLKTKLQLQLGEEAALYSKTRNKLVETQQRVRAIYATTKYDNEQLAKENLILQAETAKKDRENAIYLSAIILSTMTIAFVVYYKNQQQKKGKAMAAYQTETRISKKVHDELANDVSGIMGYIERTRDTLPKLKINLLNHLNDIYLRTRDIATETSRIDFGNFPNALKDLILQHQTHPNQVITNSWNIIAWNDIPNHKKMAIYRSLQELLVNTKKHAQATQTTLVFKDKGRKKELVYTDNGIGFDPNHKVLSGLNNVETRMQGIGGTFSFISNKDEGFKASITF